MKWRSTSLRVLRLSETENEYKTDFVAHVVCYRKRFGHAMRILPGVYALASRKPLRAPIFPSTRRYTGSNRGWISSSFRLATTRLRVLKRKATLDGQDDDHSILDTLHWHLNRYRGSLAWFGLYLQAAAQELCSLMHPGQAKPAFLD